MKKLFLLMLLLPLFATAQQFSPSNLFGKTENRFIAYNLQGMPKDTFAVPVAWRDYPWMAVKNDSTFIWSIALQRWAFNPIGFITATSLTSKENVIVAPNLQNGYWNRYKQFVPFNTDSIAQGNNLFATAAEKTTWNNKQNALGYIPKNFIDSGYVNGVTSYVTTGTLLKVADSLTGTSVSVNDIPALLTYAKHPNVVHVVDSIRGGAFNYKPASYSLTVDSGIVFSANGGGYWVRNLADAKYVDARWFGIKGNGIADDALAVQRAVNFCFGDSAHAHSRSTRNYPLRLGKGDYSFFSTVKLWQISGGLIYGDGRFTTQIYSGVNGMGLFKTNGCEYTRFADFRLIGATGDSTAILFDLDWDNTGGSALQSNTFENILWEGGGAGNRIGNSQYMGSENLFQNCFFAGQKIAGALIRNYNALQNTFVGGNFQACKVGCQVDAGSANFYSVGFQTQTDFDIKVINSANDVMTVSGCRSESANFLAIGNGANALIQNCNHTTPSLYGYFLSGGSGSTIINCNSLYGIVDGAGDLTVKNSWFGRKAWIGRNYFNLSIENVHAGETPNSVIEGAQAGSSNTLLSNNLGLMSNGYNFIVDSGIVGRWFNGAVGAFYQHPGYALSTSNPLTGYLLENDGNNRPRLRNTSGVQGYLLTSGDTSLMLSYYVPAYRKVAGFSLSSDISLADLTADGTLTFSGSYNGSTARTVGLNLGNANTWTAAQAFTSSITTPSATFSLFNSTPTTINAFGAATTINMGAASGTINVGSNSTINGGANANDKLTIQGTTNVSRATSYINLQPNGGSVGIGTSAPVQTLDVKGGINISSLSSTSGPVVLSNANNNELLIGNGVATAKFRLLPFGADAYIENNLSTGGALIFRNYVASAATERMRIDAGGNVGIGTTPNTNALLDVSSTTKGVLIPRQTAAQFAAITPTQGLLVYRTTLNKFVYSDGTNPKTLADSAWTDSRYIQSSGGNLVMSTGYIANSVGFLSDADGQTITKQITETNTITADRTVILPTVPTGTIITIRTGNSSGGTFYWSADQSIYKSTSSAPFTFTQFDQDTVYQLFWSGSQWKVQTKYHE